LAIFAICTIIIEHPGSALLASATRIRHQDETTALSAYARDGGIYGATVIYPGAGSGKILFPFRESAGRKRGNGTLHAIPGG
jgi:hypothetical protein